MRPGLGNLQALPAAQEDIERKESVMARRIAKAGRESRKQPGAAGRESFFVVLPLRAATSRKAQAGCLLKVAVGCSMFNMLQLHVAERHDVFSAAHHVAACYSISSGASETSQACRFIAVS